MASHQMKLAKKIPLLVVAPAVCAVFLLGMFSYQRSSNSLQEAAFEKLGALGASRTNVIGTYLQDVRTDLVLTASNEGIINAMLDFSTGWVELGENAKNDLQRLYLSDNPYPAGKREDLNQADDGSEYSMIHGSYHPWFHELQEERGYYDIFLIDTDGNVCYSVFKEADFATNVKIGKWKNTDLGKIWQEVGYSSALGKVAFSDFAAYAPSAGAAASFIGTPIIDTNGDPLGALVYQMPIGKINDIMQQTEGLGESGETYLVGADYMMRSDSRFSETSTILTDEVRTATVALALQKKNGALITPDYRGIDVLSVYNYVEFEDILFAVLCEVDLSEVNLPAQALMWQLIIGIIFVGLIVAVIGFFAAKGVTAPVSELTQTMNTMADGELDIIVPHSDRSDELGDIAKAMDIFKQNGLQMKEMEAESARKDVSEREERRNMMLKMADDFESSVGQIVQAVSSAAEEMQATAQTMAALSEETSNQATTVAAASEQSSANIDTVASAAEELTSSIKEISRQVTESAHIATTAVRKSGDANKQVESLTETVNKISSVVEIINGIAEKTNLLALNATIEAARAGEAGKGFAVVAEEVKTLANQTTQATGDIRSQIAEIEVATKLAADSIQEISTVIKQNDEIVASIAGAVEEQGSSTNEIARNVEQAALGSNEVSTNISSVTTAAAETGTVSSQVLSASTELGKNSGKLSEEMQRFLLEIRSE
jgi:methyl-accepting chemotaxis protein